MILYAKYDDDNEFVDVIYIPDSPRVDIELKQKMFFKWLFDKRNNHEYWRVVDGEKKYCEYDVEAFIKWLNEEVYMDLSNKARVVTKRTSKRVLDSIVLMF